MAGESLLHNLIKAAGDQALIDFLKVAHNPDGTNIGGGGSPAVKDGSTTVNPTTTLNFTSGATVTDAGGGQANVAIAGGGGTGLMIPVSRSSNTILGTSDIGKFFSLTAAFTQTLTAAATLGAGWWCWLKNDTTDGATVVVVDPNASETIDGLTTITMYSGETRLLICDGTNFVSKMEKGGFVVFTATGNFIVPTGISMIEYDLIGPGGNGGAGASGANGTARPGGAGGGGGARCQGSIPASLFTAGATEPVTLSASTTTFKSSQVYKGGAGLAGSSGSNQTGGSGGGTGEFGLPSDIANNAGGGHRTPVSGLNGSLPGQGGCGADAPLYANNPTGLGADWGGGSGGPSDGAGAYGSGTPKGGTSNRGGGGGGGGGGSPTGNTNTNGGDGGNSGFYTDSAGNGGGTGGASAGAAGAAGANGTDGNAGKGGGGGASNSGATGGAGGNGGIPGGGGGGGGGGLTGGSGGTGGRGEARIYYR